MAKPCKACTARLQAAPAQPEPAQGYRSLLSKIAPQHSRVLGMAKPCKACPATLQATQRSPEPASQVTEGPLSP
ncbi:hypothetical protein, partial [Desulfoluna sp.]|uniref:hypothetical protein n=1 Tax=Desulfoluna sp. TaxID=2045199 RepID=UPI00262BABF2